MAEILLYTRRVINGDYVEECGFKCDIIGDVYCREDDVDAFRQWFRTHMWPKGWTITCGGPANPYCPEYDTQGNIFDKVFSIKRHYQKAKGIKGVLGPYKKTIIRL